MKLQADRRTRASRTSTQMKHDRRTSAGRATSKLKADRRTSANRTSAKLKADARTSASRTAAKSKADYTIRGIHGDTRDPPAKVFGSPPFTFAPNSVGSACFCLCIEADTGHSARSQRAILPIATQGDLELYRYPPHHGFPEGDLAAAIDMNAEEAHVSDICTHRARVVVAETAFCRAATDLPGLGSAVIRSSYWSGPIEVGRIQLSMDVKVVVLSNLGMGSTKLSTASYQTAFWPSRRTVLLS